MRRDDIRTMIREFGAQKVGQAFADLFEGRDGQGRQVRKLDPASISVRAVWEAAVGPVEDTLPSMRRGGSLNFIELQEAVDSSAFASIIGFQLAAKVIEGYGIPGLIGDRLVTTMTSRLRNERIPGFTSLEGPTDVPEGMPYQESGIAAKYVTTEASKKGRILEITEEAITHDQTGQLLLRAQRLGEATREERELTILAGVVDVGSGAAGYRDVYRPSGVAATLYDGANTNYVSNATPLVDWTDIDEVFQYHAENMRDDRPVVGERLPVTWMPQVLLVSRKKAGTAARILSATEHRSGDITAGAGNQMVSGNPLTNIAPGLVALSSPLLDYLAGVAGSRYSDSDDWFIGDFAKQFVWQEIWPLQTMRARQDDEAAFSRDIVARFKVRYYGGIAAVDTKYVIKVNDT
jgi:hypothetical protein